MNGVVLLIVAALTVSILVMNEGRFVYTLDDPYIHLAVSERIWQGEYGINRGEFAAPSSSIIFPFLLTLGAWSSFHEYLPFLINLALLFLTLEILRRFAGEIGLIAEHHGSWIAALLIGVVTVTFNLIGIAFTGMEHSAHVAVVAATVLGLTIVLKRDVVPWWLPVCIVLGPLVRYESLALSCSAILLLAISGRWLWALVSAAGVALTVGGFSAFLLSHGVGLLPTSVLVKSTAAASTSDGAITGAITAVLRNVTSALENPTGTLMSIAAGLFALAAMAHGGLSLAQKKMAFALVLTAAGHVALGQFGWLARYEVYAMVAVLMMAVFVAEGWLRTILEGHSGRQKFVLSALIVFLIAGFTYWQTTALTPLASNNVYEQQYQTHRFLTGYLRAPAAVNDLGWPGYRNEHYVLDIWGLASKQAWLLRLKEDSAGLVRLIQDRGVKAVIIYDAWFAGVRPPGWTRVGQMYLSRRRTSAAINVVSFYAARPEFADDIRQKLKQFAATVPDRVRIVID